MEEIVEEINWPVYDAYLNKRVFIVSDILVDKTEFKKCFNELYGFMKSGFEQERVRKHPVHFKFTNNEHEMLREMEIRHFIINLIFWRPFLELNAVSTLNSSFIMDCKSITAKSVKRYIDDKIIIPYRRSVESRDINRICERLIYELSRISNDFNVIMGMSINIESFIDLSKKHPRFNEIIRTKIPAGMQPKEIEGMLNNLMHEEINILKAEPNVLQPMLKSGAGIKDKQLAEFSISGGLKPDISGNTIPVPINTNFLVGGLKDISSYYVDAQAGRKSTILNKTSMGTSGFFAAKCIMVSSTQKLSKRFRKSHGKMTVEESACNTKKLVAYDVKTADHLRKVDDRFYYDDPDMNGPMKEVNAVKDTDLVGKTIYMRSPMTCTCDDGICPACYGELAYTNSNRHLTVGSLASTTLNNPLQQKILSTKHLLTTVSEELKFIPRFYDFFILDANKFKLNPDLKDIKNWYLQINKDDIDEFQDKEDNIDFNIFTDKFRLYNKKTKEVVDIEELNNTSEFYFYADIIGMMRNTADDKYKELALDDVEDEQDIIYMNIENNELTRPLKLIMKLLDRKDHNGCTTIDELVNRMADLLIECGHESQLIHAETVMRSIIKSTDNILEQPKFNDPACSEDYQILTVSSALLNNPSLTVSLAFQDLGKQVVNPVTNRKFKKSSYDDLFRLTLD